MKPHAIEAAERGGQFELVAGVQRGHLGGNNEGELTVHVGELGVIEGLGVELGGDAPRVATALDDSRLEKQFSGGFRLVHDVFFHLAKGYPGCDGGELGGGGDPVKEVFVASPKIAG